MPGSEAVLPHLRQDLRLYKGARDKVGGACWLVYDPVRHRYFQVSHHAFELLSVWCAISPETFLESASAKFTREVTRRELDELIHFILSNNLSDDAPGRDPLAYAKQVASNKRSALSQLLHNYLSFKIPLWRPQRFLEATLPFVRLLFSRTAVVLLALISLVGIYLASRQWDAFAAEFVNLISLEGAVLYGIGLIFVATMHELGHAYAAARLGARVNTIGVAFMVLMPTLYTDVTDAWRLTERRKRLSIDAAGIAVELAIAGLATFVWAFLPDGPARSMAFVLATTSWVLSVAINLNPFMRFDGYYILADGWGIANLQTRAFNMARWYLRELLFGFGHKPPESFPKLTRNLLISYAIGTWIYRFFLFLGIALVVYHFAFKALGIVLFAVEIVWFIVLPVARELKSWWAMRSDINDLRRTLITGSIISCQIVVLLLPWGGTVRLPAVVAQQEIQLFPPRPAKLVDVRFADGQVVAEGDVLAHLHAPDLDFEIEQTRRRIALANSRLDRIAGDDADRSLRNVITGELKSQTEKLTGLLEEQSQLMITAPFAGVVRDVPHDILQGQWVKHTRALMRIVAREKLEAKGYAHEADIWQLDRGQAAVFYPEEPLRDSQAGTLIDVAYAGSRNLEIPYLASVYGGSIASSQNDDGEIRPKSSRYLVSIAIEGPPPERAVRGTIHVSGKPESVVYAIWQRLLKVLVRESGI